MTLILSGTDGLSDVDGSAATPAIRGTDTNTGMFFPAADTIAFSEGGVESMRINSSGQVGIGTASPAYKLDVTGSGATTCQIERTDGTYVLALKGSGTSSVGALGMATNDMVMLTNGSERMRINSTGKVGIGTTNPSGDFTVSNGGANGFEINPTEGSGASTKINSFNRSTSVYTTLQFDALDFRVATGSSATERMRIASDGTISTTIGSTLYGAYSARAWVNFNGTGTVAIRQSRNVSSITDNNTGDYTVNFTTAMPDGEYALSGGASRGSGDTSTNGPFAVGIFQATTPATGSVRIQTGYGGSQASAGSNQDAVYVCVAIHR
jgi:hypothetical protein